MVMIVCMIAVPLLAVFGTGWLPLKSWFGDNSFTRETSNLPPLNLNMAGPAKPNGQGGSILQLQQIQPSPLASQPLTAPSLFDAEGSPAQALKPTILSETPASSPNEPTPTAVPAPPPVATLSGNPPANPSAAIAPATSAPSAVPAPAGNERPIRSSARGVPGRRYAANASADNVTLAVHATPAVASVAPSAVVNAVNVRPLESVVAPAGDSTGTPSPSGGQRELRGKDWFADAQQRLRELGATYYLLETWGQNGQLYRFHCRMAHGAQGDAVQNFEATDTDPAAAVKTVVEQVEAWRRQQSQ
ncbi:MAG: hypothetical protein JSS27_13120 [Planctomycetes bacterium]|nr:hypothetical protein [Planctomycetota bacterium]